MNGEELTELNIKGVLGIMFNNLLSSNKVDAIEIGGTSKGQHI